MADLRNEMQATMPTQQPNPQQTWANYQFSPDELRVLRECNAESFFQRSMPLGIALGTGTYLAVQKGMLKPSAKFGALPKVLASIAVGYFLGKFSYQQKCAEKLMRLPNSRLAEVLRQRQGAAGFAPGTFMTDSFDGSSAFGTQDSLSKTPFNNDDNVSGATSMLDWDSRPNISGLDDTYRPTVDSVGVYDDTELRVKPVTPGVSYDDLRRQNREEYLKKQNSSYLGLKQQQQLQQQQQQQQLPNRQGIEDENVIKAGKTNKYGDNWT